jgi:hypothetical protein
MSYPEDTDPEDIDAIETMPDEDDPVNAGLLRDPGIDRHDFAGEWATLWEEAHEDPREALPELVDLVGRLMRRHGYVIEQDDPVAQGDEREILATYWAAREVSDAVDEDGPADAGDIAQAINDVRDIYESLIDRVEGNAH